MQASFFGKLPDGLEAKIITLSNNNGMQVELLNYGAAIHRIKTPDINGVIGDITLYCTTLDDYRQQRAFLGATIGRFANRISKAAFTLKSQPIKLSANEGDNQLHGGPVGFDKRIWSYTFGSSQLGEWVRFTLTSEDGDQGFPGELHTQVEYLLDNTNRLQLNITAQSSKPTIINMTNHTYFNLSGKPPRDLSLHYFKIYAEQYLDIDSEGIPTGDIRNVSDTALDLRLPREISKMLEPLAEELTTSRGYDHNYVFADTGNLAPKARVIHAESGRALSISSNNPGVQFYSGNYLRESNVIGPGGSQYRNYSGFCMEPQRFPDSPNHTHFPDCSLQPDETYIHTIEYQFSTIDIEDSLDI